MKFILPKPRVNISNAMRRCGYHFKKEDKEKRELVFYHIIGVSRTGYPRFHIYLKVSDEQVTFSLHLDQKRPIYKGTPAHAAEYSGEIIEKEVERIRQILEGL